MERAEGVEQTAKAGSIKRITLENFMCHSNLTIEFGDRVNFITGQNGSGKSAILTALCVAFGMRAKGTQRANAIKDFVKTGCSYGLVVVVLNNTGEDAFKPDVFGESITLERRITESQSTFTLKDSQGRKVGDKKKADVLDIVNHFNIEVDNPCVIMTQDKSREFLHKGTDHENFKFYFSATLLQQFSEILMQWEHTLDSALLSVDGSLKDLQPMRDELKQVEGCLNVWEQVELQTAQCHKLEVFYAWASVEAVEKELHNKEEDLRRLEARIPKCQKAIEDAELEVKRKEEALAEKDASVARIMHDTELLRQNQTKLRAAVTETMKEQFQAEEDLKRARRSVDEEKKSCDQFEQEIQEMRTRMLRDTQAEASVRLQEMEDLQENARKAWEVINRLKVEENAITSELDALAQQQATALKEVEDFSAQLQELKSYIRNLKSQQTNKVTAFGGDAVLRLLEEIEKNHQRFTRPPVGPVGVHVGVVDDKWSGAVEVAIGPLLNSFVVTNHNDSMLLRELGNKVQFRHLSIKIYDFTVPLIRPAPNQLPEGHLLTVLAALQCQSSLITNLLIDQGGVDQKVLVEDYHEGKGVAFNGGTRNVKEVITVDGTRMYSRAGAETTLPKDRRSRGGRLGVRVDEQILQAASQEMEIETVKSEAVGRKRKFEEESGKLRQQTESLKKRRGTAERYVREQEYALRDLRNAASNDAQFNTESSVIELEQAKEVKLVELQNKQDSCRQSEIQIEAVQEKCTKAQYELNTLFESAKRDFEALEVAEDELATLREELTRAEGVVNHYRNVMEIKVVAKIEAQQQENATLGAQLEERRKEASLFCSEEERKALGFDPRTREQLNLEIRRLTTVIARQQNKRESLEELSRKKRRLARKISSKENAYVDMQEKLNILKTKREERMNKYRRSCRSLAKELLWAFQENLRRKGQSGTIKVDYEKKELSMTVQMPQDASREQIRDTKGLSGGERSFATLAFTLAIHKMTEAPFRAMDEFDVYLDQVGREISLDTAVDFAIEQGSQWIFITPQDISKVKGSALVKKQQMPAPRP